MTLRIVKQWQDIFSENSRKLNEENEPNLLDQLREAQKKLLGAKLRIRSKGERT
jgi:hypothetical protein